MAFCMTDYASWRWHVTRFISRVKLQKTIALATIVLAFGAGSYCLAQMAGDSQLYADMPQPTMPENELENLAAPIALYPDALLSQVLVASTYPQEVAEAQRWLQENGYLRGRELMAAAQEQSWDPSVQALVAFPDVVERMNRNMGWTTELGNAFLGQQADVMSAIQNLRAEARGGGQLEGTPQLAVNLETQGEQSAIDILPADPQRMYVPNYDPYAVWGAPTEGDYPALPYAEGSGFGDLFGTVANLATLLPGFAGLLGPQNWGWAIGWLAQTLFVNNAFFNDFGFHNYDGGSQGSSVWVHNEQHRLGRSYGNRVVAGGGRGRNGRGTGTGRGDGWRDFGHGTRASAGWQRNNGTERGSNWREFGGAERTATRGRSDGWQTNRSGRDHFANSGYNRAGSFTGSRSFGSGSGYSDLRRPVRGVENSRLSNRSRGGTPRVSSARMTSERGPSYGRAQRGYSSREFSSRGYSSRGSSSRGSSSREFSSRGSSLKHGFSSHSSGPKAPKAPKAPHYAKSHGGGHSSGGHGGKKSHRG